jgi:hypothetical protein
MSNFIRIRPVVSKINMRTDRQTSMTSLYVHFMHFMKEMHKFSFNAGTIFLTINGVGRSQVLVAVRCDVMWFRILTLKIYDYSGTVYITIILKRDKIDTTVSTFVY